MSNANIQHLLEKGSQLANAEQKLKNIENDARFLSALDRAKDMVENLNTYLGIDLLPQYDNDIEKAAQSLIQATPDNDIYLSYWTTCAFSEYGIAYRLQENLYLSIHKVKADQIEVAFSTLSDEEYSTGTHEKFLLHLPSSQEEWVKSRSYKEQLPPAIRAMNLHWKEFIQYTIGNELGKFIPRAAAVTKRRAELREEQQVDQDTESPIRIDCYDDSLTSRRKYWTRLQEGYTERSVSPYTMDENEGIIVVWEHKERLSKALDHKPTYVVGDIVETTSLPASTLFPNIETTPAQQTVLVVGDYVKPRYGLKYHNKVGRVNKIFNDGKWFYASVQFQGMTEPQMYLIDDLLKMTNQTEAE